MKEMSLVGKEMLAFQEKLANEYKYEPIGISLFLGDVRERYRAALPKWCDLDGNAKQRLYSLDGTLLCTGYTRIVIGDYGAFVEIAPSRIVKNNICCKPGQEYRYSADRFAAHVKYLWLTAKDKSDCKVYFQKKRVSYADYIPGMYYISPYEVFVNPKEEAYHEAT